MGRSRWGAIQARGVFLSEQVSPWTPLSTGIAEHLAKGFERRHLEGAVGNLSAQLNDSVYTAKAFWGN